MTRPINIAILVVALIGGVLAFKQHHETRILEDEYNRLTATFGELDVNDESKFHVAFVPSDDDKMFRWRAFYPAGLGLRTESDSPNGSTGGTNTRASATTEVVTCAFRFETQKIMVFVGGSGSGNTLMSIGSGLATPFLKEHWDELEFSILGKDGMEILDDSSMLTFIEITIPELLADQMVKELGPMSERYRKRVFRLRTGTQAAFVKNP